MPKSCSRLLSSGEARPPSTLASNAAAISSLQRRLRRGRRRGREFGQRVTRRTSLMAGLAWSSQSTVQLGCRAAAPASNHASCSSRSQLGVVKRNKMKATSHPPEGGHGGGVPHMGQQGLQVGAQRGIGGLRGDLQATQRRGRGARERAAAVGWDWGGTVLLEVTSEPFSHQLTAAGPELPIGSNPGSAACLEDGDVGVDARALRQRLQLDGHVACAAGGHMAF